MQQLSWEQVHTWRLARHQLRPTERPAAILDVVQGICGLHAQLLPAAELALWARRTALAPGDLETALWERRTLVKTWVMRGTLHVLAADDLPLYAAARRTHTPRRPPSYYTYHGVTPEELAAIEVGVPAVLGAEGLTREELAEAVAARAGTPRLAEVLRSGWGALLKPAAARGALCFGPNRGRNVTFVAPAAWLEAWQELDPQVALREVAHRYLAAYGPATPEEFARWWGDEPAAVKRLFRALGDELAAVEVEGWRGWALAASVPELAGADPGLSVALLPAFDPYTVALLKQPAVLAPTHTAHISRPQGWISPAVLVGGRIAGTWEHELRRDTTHVQVTLFAPMDDEVHRHLAAEVERLGAFLGTATALSFA
ncbi:MAG: winged helix DNA-binding domain-containing protein [Chloroflexales bacterium]|nr:winged helix DNA-binding domain-containing protein [Chloroflexales bacterium]